MSEPHVAVVQFAPVHGHPEVNRARSRVLVCEAAAAGANLVVLPECVTTGYAHSSKADLLSIAETVPGPTTEVWRDVATGSGVWIVGGLAERDDHRLYNTAIVVSPSGSIYRYRKIHLWGVERDLYDPGDAPLVVETPWGGLGVAICYDLWFPELFRILALGGASLIAVPANWAGNPRVRDPFDEYGLPTAVHMAMATACSNEITIACADRTGSEGNLTFLGSSCIVSPTGRLATRVGHRTADEILVADWADAGRIRRTGQSHLGSRRADIYDIRLSSASRFSMAAGVTREGT